jgi:hypothetical protein
MEFDALGRTSRHEFPSKSKHPDEKYEVDIFSIDYDQIIARIACVCAPLDLINSDTQQTVRVSTEVSIGKSSRVDESPSEY